MLRPLCMQRSQKISMINRDNISITMVENSRLTILAVFIFTPVKTRQAFVTAFKMRPNKVKNMITKDIVVSFGIRVNLSLTSDIIFEEFITN